MKDGLAAEAIDRIALALTSCDPQFEADSFRSQALTGLQPLSLKQRVHHIIGALHQHLPADYEKAAQLMIQLPNHWTADDSWNYSPFAAWPLIDYHASYGLHSPSLALDTLAELTQMFTAEFAIRPFILQHAEISHQKLEQWIHSDNEHIRRLASEGSRPRLPWGEQLKPHIEDPQKCLYILNALRHDDSLYVRKSVANHLNDISKDHPATALQIARDWTTNNPSKYSSWIVKHGMRSLIKQGHPEVFSLLGFSSQPDVSHCQLDIQPTSIRIGEAVQMTFSAKSMAEQKLALDYAIHFVKANGQRRAKVFKGKVVDAQKGQVIQLEKSHSFKLITTRKYYPGEHHLEIILNGKVVANGKFQLQVADC